MSIEQETSLDTSKTRELIESLFFHRDAIDRHLNAPMLEQRAGYLAGLLAMGRSRRHVTEIASVVCHAIPLLGSAESRAVDEGIIAEVAERWSAQSPESSAAIRTRNFKAVARSWSRFLGVYVAHTQPRFIFEGVYAEFMKALPSELHYLPASVQYCASPVRQFLSWASLRHASVGSITIHDIDAFISEQRARAWSEQTIVGSCWALRTFFRYAERRGWTGAGLDSKIKTAKLKPHPKPSIVPSWRKVRRVITALDEENPSYCRAKAVLLLASVYGLRCAEIVRLTLEDFDWYKEVLTVRRAKRGRVQQFPIQYEVGEAIIRYLQKVRPPCRFRNVFITLQTPYRPATHIGPAIRLILGGLRIIEHPCGLHAFRHACATELLRTGTSLRGIADFLGHRNLRSVSIYAQSDLRALRSVSNLSLHGLL